MKGISLLSMAVLLLLLHSGRCFHVYSTLLKSPVCTFVRMRSDEPKEKSIVDQMLRLDQANVFQNFGFGDNADDDRVEYGDGYDGDDPDSNPFLDWMRKVSTSRGHVVELQCLSISASTLHPLSFIHFNPLIT